MSKLGQLIHSHKSLLLWVSALVLLLIFSSAFAEGEGLDKMGEKLGTAMKSFETVISWGSYLAGLAFAIGAIMKFKQHKDNPSNIPIGTPIALLFVAVALIFLPSLANTIGATMFGTPEHGSDKFFKAS